MMKMVLVLINIASSSSICSERMCKICDSVFHRKKSHEFCRNLFQIENCCEPFLQSCNLLGPATHKKAAYIEENNNINGWSIPIGAGIGFGLILVIIGIVSRVIRTHGPRIWGKSMKKTSTWFPNFVIIFLWHWLIKNTLKNCNLWAAKSNYWMRYFKGIQDVLETLILIYLHIWDS